MSPINQYNSIYEGTEIDAAIGKIVENLQKEDQGGQEVIQWDKNFDFVDGITVQTDSTTFLKLEAKESNEEIKPAILAAVEDEGVVGLKDENGNDIVLRGVAAPVNDNDVVNKEYVDEKIAQTGEFENGITIASQLNSGVTLTRSGGGTDHATTAYIDEAGNLVIKGEDNTKRRITNIDDPTSNYDVVNKHYLQSYAQASGESGNIQTDGSTIGQYQYRNVGGIKVLTIGAYVSSDKAQYPLTFSGVSNPSFLVAMASAMPTGIYVRFPMSPTYSSNPESQATNGQVYFQVKKAGSESQVEGMIDVQSIPGTGMIYGSIVI